MTRIVLTGGSGMLGQSLIPKLLEEGHHVNCLSRTVAYKNIIVDYSYEESVHRALDEIKPDFIVNLVGLTDVDECDRNPHKAYIANVSVVETLASWVGKNNHCHLIQISTDHVYDGSKSPIEKNVTIYNHYAFSKYAGEIVARGVNSTILRTNFFGKSLNPKRQSFSDWAVNEFSSGRKLFLLSDVFFSPLSLNTLCSYICHIIKNPVTGTFNLGSKNGSSKANFVISLAKLLKQSDTNLEIGSIKYLDLIAPRPLDMRMDCSKFESTFNLELPNLDEEIKLIKKDYIHATR